MKIFYKLNRWLNRHERQLIEIKWQLEGINSSLKKTSVEIQALSLTIFNISEKYLFNKHKEEKKNFTSREEFENALEKITNRKQP